MTAQKHSRSRAKRYSRRKPEYHPPETECLICRSEIKNRGSELCDECELKYLGR